MQWLFRKQLECRVNALFFIFDETGKSARLYHYFEMEKRFSLQPENEDLRQMLRLAYALLEDEITEIKEKNKDLRGDWVGNISCGKTLHGPSQQTGIHL